MANDDDFKFDQRMISKEKTSRSFLTKIMIRLNSYSFRYKILVLVIFIMVISITLISTFFFFFVYPSEVELRISHHHDDLISLGDSFEQEINLSRQDVFSFSESSFFMEAISILGDSNASVRELTLSLARQQFIDIAEHSDQVLEVRFINNSYHEVIDIEYNLTAGVFRSNEDEELVPPLFRSMFDGIRSNYTKGEIYTSNLQLDRENLDLPVIEFATPILDDSGSFVGIVVVTVYLQPTFDRLVARMKQAISPTADLAMIDSSGYFLFDTTGIKWTSPENGGNGSTIFDVYPNMPLNFFISEGLDVYYDDLIFLTPEVLLKARLNVEFSDSNFKVYFVLTLPSEVVYADADALFFTTIFFVVISSLLVAVFIMFASEIGLVRPLLALRDQTRRLSEGDLTLPVEQTLRGDELGQLQNQFYFMVTSLRELVSTIMESNDLITSISENVTTQSEEVTAAAEEVAASVQNVTKGASSQADMIMKVNTQLSTLRDMIARVIKEIQANVQQINEIAQLTRILSLNATIEASRAGKDASGFMVIAENVQNLARDSRKAAATINSISKELREKVQFSIDLVLTKMDEVASVSEETAALAEEVSASVAEVIGAMEEMVVLSQTMSNHATRSAEVVSKFSITLEDDVSERSLE